MDNQLYIDKWSVHLQMNAMEMEVKWTLSLVLYVCFVDRCLSFCTFLLAIVLSVHLRFTDSDYYTFGIVINLTYITGTSWSWSYGSWINNYTCNKCPSPLKLWVQIPFMVSCTRYNISCIYWKFVTRLTRRVPLVEQELSTLPKHLGLPPLFCGIH
jgi:hypothetical protein